MTTDIMRFRDLEVGDVFEFVYEPGKSRPLAGCGLERGPWIKTSYRKYVKQGMECKVGSVMVCVRKLDVPASSVLSPDGAVSQDELMAGLLETWDQLMTKGGTNDDTPFGPPDHPGNGGLLRGGYQPAGGLLGVC